MWCELCSVYPRSTCQTCGYLCLYLVSNPAKFLCASLDSCPVALLSGLLEVPHVAGLFASLCTTIGARRDSNLVRANRTPRIRREPAAIDFCYVADEQVRLQTSALCCVVCLWWHLHQCVTRSVVTLIKTTQGIIKQWALSRAHKLSLFHWQRKKVIEQGFTWYEHVQ